MTAVENFFRMIVFICCILSVVPCLGQEKDEYRKIGKALFVAEIIGKNVQLIDVRTPQEYEKGHIDNALNFNINEKEVFLKQVSSLDKKEPVYLYCEKGGRSNRAAELMKSMGFTKIYDYSGGYDEWKSTD